MKKVLGTTPASRPSNSGRLEHTNQMSQSDLGASEAESDCVWWGTDRSLPSGTRLGDKLWRPHTFKHLNESGPSLWWNDKRDFQTVLQAYLSAPAVDAAFRDKVGHLLKLKFIDPSSDTSAKSIGHLVDLLQDDFDNDKLVEPRRPYKWNEFYSLHAQQKYPVVNQSTIDSLMKGGASLLKRFGVTPICEWQVPCGEVENTVKEYDVTDGEGKVFRFRSQFWVGDFDNATGFYGHTWDRDTQESVLYTSGEANTIDFASVSRLHSEKVSKRYVPRAYTRFEGAVAAALYMDEEGDIYDDDEDESDGDGSSRRVSFVLKTGHQLEFIQALVNKVAFPLAAKCPRDVQKRFAAAAIMHCGMAKKFRLDSSAVKAIAKRCRLDGLPGMGTKFASPHDVSVNVLKGSGFHKAITAAEVVDNLGLLSKLPTPIPNNFFHVSDYLDIQKRIENAEKQKKGSMSTVVGALKSRARLHDVVAKVSYTAWEVFLWLVTTVGVDINSIDQTGATPLHICASNHEVYERVSTLKKLGARVNVKDKMGRTPIMVAASTGVVQGMFAAVSGAKTTDESSLMIAALMDAGADINVSDDTGKSLLHWCAIHGYDRAVPALVHHGLDVNARDELGWSPLDYAEGKSARKEGNLVKFLVSKGAKSTKPPPNTKGAWGNGAAASPSASKWFTPSANSTVSAHDASPSGHRKHSANRGKYRSRVGSDTNSVTSMFGAMGMGGEMSSAASGAVSGTSHIRAPAPASQPKKPTGGKTVSRPNQGAQPLPPPAASTFQFSTTAKPDSAGALPPGKFSFGNTQPVKFTGK